MSLQSFAPLTFLRKFSTRLDILFWMYRIRLQGERKYLEEGFQAAILRRAMQCLGRLRGMGPVVTEIDLTLNS
jgi:hypothetical protein